VHLNLINQQLATLTSENAISPALGPTTSPTVTAPHLGKLVIAVE